MAILRNKLINDFTSIIKGEMTEEQFITNLALNYTPKELAQYIYTRMLNEIENEPITITQTQFRTLLSIFKIKGVRGFRPNGEMILETRGSKENRPEEIFGQKQINDDINDSLFQNEKN